MYNHILIPVAFDHEADTERALGVAESLLAGDGQITLLHVLEQVPAYVASQIGPEVFDHNRAEAQAMLERAAAGRGARIACETVTGHAGRTIPDFATRAGVDCIVIPSHDPGLQDYLLGSTAGRVVRHAHCAVHVLR